MHVAKSALSRPHESHLRCQIVPSACARRHGGHREHSAPVTIGALVDGRALRCRRRCSRAGIRPVDRGRVRHDAGSRARSRRTHHRLHARLGGRGIDREPRHRRQGQSPARDHDRCVRARRASRRAGAEARRSRRRGRVPCLRSPRRVGCGPQPAVVLHRRLVLGPRRCRPRHHDLARSAQTGAGISCRNGRCLLAERRDRRQPARTTAQSSGIHALDRRCWRGCAHRRGRWSRRRRHGCRRSRSS